jgi:hypothetical protein
MSTLTAKRGDTWRVRLESLVDENNAPAALSNVVIRAQVRRSIGAEVLLRGTSYPGGSILVTEPAAPNAEAEWRVSPADTMALAPREHVYDWEINRRGASVATTGTASVAAGSEVVTLSDALPVGTRAEDVLIEITSGADEGLYLVTALSADRTEATVEGFDGWTTASGLTFTLRRNERWTPVGGVVIVTGDVTR